MKSLPTYIDFIMKLVSYLGIDYDENNNETDSPVIKELRSYNSQYKYLSEKYLPKIIRQLSGDDLEKGKVINFFLALIESRMRYLIDKDLITLATQERGMWVLFVFYYIPQLSILISNYKIDFQLSGYIFDNECMMPSIESGKIVSPTDKLIRYLKEKIQDDDFIGDYVDELKSFRTPRYQTKARILRKLKSKKNKLIDIEEVGAVIHCAIFMSHLYRDLCRTFKDKNRVIHLIEYFKICLKACDDLYLGDTVVDEGFNFHRIIGLHLSFVQLEIKYMKAEIESPLSQRYNKLKNQRIEAYKEILAPIDLYLKKTSLLTRDVLESINIEDLSKGMLRYYVGVPFYIISDRDHGLIISTFDLLESYFAQPKVLKKNEIYNLLSKIKRSDYISHYKIMYFYYESLYYHCGQ